ncbi:MAG: hypothetical protein NC098_01380 [Lachnoclostridium sp.]|nr:hypothetical protein [Lachnoclostridium sp.]
MNHDNENDFFLHDFEEKPAADNHVPEAGEKVDFSGNPSTENKQEKPAKRGNGCLKSVIWTVVIALVVLAGVMYVRYAVPYVTDSKVTGYVTTVEKRGMFFKTFEGEMISQSALDDSSRIYSRDFQFSIPDDSLARVIQSYQSTGQKVTLTLEKYYGTLPWRGASRTIAVAVEP